MLAWKCKHQLKNNYILTVILVISSYIGHNLLYMTNIFLIALYALHYVSKNFIFGATFILSTLGGILDTVRINGYSKQKFFISLLSLKKTPVGYGSILNLLLLYPVYRCCGVIII